MAYWIPADKFGIQFAAGWEGAGGGEVSSVPQGDLKSLKNKDGRTSTGLHGNPTPLVPAVTCVRPLVPYYLLVPAGRAGGDLGMR